MSPAIVRRSWRSAWQAHYAAKHWASPRALTTISNHTSEGDSQSPPPFAPVPVLNLKDIRSRPQKYAENCVRRNYEKEASAPHRIAALHDEWDKSQRDSSALRERNNKHRALMKTVMDKGEVDVLNRDKLLKEAREIKDQLSKVEIREENLQKEMSRLALSLPNLTSEDTPTGDEPKVLDYINDGNAAASRVSQNAKSHVDIGRELKLLDWDASSASSGFGWYFLLNEAALMEQALVQYALSVASNKGWTVVSPPSMVYSHITAACGFKPRDQNGEQQIYSIAQEGRDENKPGLSLAGTAEIPLAAMKARQTLDAKELPLKMVGSSRCYRAEAGARGKKGKGLYRVHEFTKVELFAWTLPDSATDSDMPGHTPQISASQKVFMEITGIQKEILQSLNLPCRVLEMPSGDLGASAFRKWDIEAFFPSRRESGGGWGEVTSASMCTDYQARRLQTRLSTTSSKKLPWPYTVNGTALAVPRVLAAILENGWDETAGEVKIPEVLVPWMEGRRAISREK